MLAHNLHYECVMYTLQHTDHSNLKLHLLHNFMAHHVNISLKFNMKRAIKTYYGSYISSFFFKSILPLIGKKNNTAFPKQKSQISIVKSIAYQRNRPLQDIPTLCIKCLLNLQIQWRKEKKKITSQLKHGNSLRETVRQSA